jgi:hypothetical protein
MAIRRIVPFKAFKHLRVMQERCLCCYRSDAHERGHSLWEGGRLLDRVTEHVTLRHPTGHTSGECSPRSRAVGSQV